MNRDDIIRMAKQAGFERLGHDEHDYVCYPDDIVAFAALVASAEREACANICEALELPEWPNKVRQPLAQAIRARGQK
jgi:hypothetical protein